VPLVEYIKAHLLFSKHPYITIFGTCFLMATMDHKSFKKEWTIKAPKTRAFKELL